MTKVKYILAALIVLLPLKALALDYGLLNCGDTDAATFCAATCSRADVGTAYSSASAAGGGTVHIPPGDCTWDTRLAVVGNVSFQGAGIGSTILRLGTVTSLMSHRYITTSATWSDFSFYADKDRGQSYSDLGQFLDCKFFRVTRTHMEGYWNGIISFKRTKGGLIDNNTFILTRQGSQDYGITADQENVVTGAKEEGAVMSPACGTPAQCNAAWNAAWWEDTSRNKTAPPYPNLAILNYLVGAQAAEDAVYIENNNFTWGGSVFMHNWSGITGMVIRYNTIVNYDGNSGGIKYGNKFFEIYRNKFTNTATGAPSSEAMYLRANGLYHNNEFYGYSYKGAIHTWPAGTEGYGYRSTENTEMHDSHFWGNTCPSCADPSLPDRDSQYGHSTDGVPSVEGVNFVFRAPQPGDRHYPYVEYTCPHPSTGVVGTCSTTIAGQEGYNVSSTPTPTPNPPYDFYFHYQEP